MDKMMRSGSQGGGGAVAGGELALREYQYYYHGGAGGGLVGQEMAVAPAPSDDRVVLLMELLDDEEEMEDGYSPASAVTGGVRDGDGDADRLSRVIRSLEAEIGGGATGAVAAATTMDSDESMAAGPASDDDGAAAGISRLEDMFSDDLDRYGGGPFWYSWPAELAVPAAAHEVGGWCVYSDEHLYYGDGSVDEQVYSPLWEQ